MLPKFYRFRIVNEMGAQIDFSGDDANNTFVINAEGWKFDSSGALVYSSSELNVFLDPTANLPDGLAAGGASQDNSSDLFMGLNCYAKFTTDCASSGRLDIYYEYSTDGGTTYPSDAADLVESEDLIFRRSIIHPGGSAGSPQVKAVNFSI